MRSYRTDTFAQILALQTVEYPITLQKRLLTQPMIERETRRIKSIAKHGADLARLQRRKFKHDIGNYLVPVSRGHVYEPDAAMTADEIAREIERLNALPLDQQTIVACDAMGYDVRDYLMEKLKLNVEIQHEIDWMDL